MPDVIARLTPSKVEKMRAQIRKVHSQFSSLHGIVNMTMHVLESRMLPVKARTYEQCNLLAERVRCVAASCAVGPESIFFINALSTM